MKPRTFILTLAAMLTGSPVAPLHAQQFTVPWFKIAGGGAMQSTGGVYELSGTIGQSDAGGVASSDGVYRLEGGFWGIAIQKGGYPTLTITRASSNALLSWTTPDTGFVLQIATDLGAPTPWTDSGFADAVTGTTHIVTVPLSWGPKAFFRLRRP
jgi:hypothetical protein